ncbi:F-box protein PP2-B10 [Neltuma alba]|uniref:F-box protein PP2-B10-like n=1 Tax=Neltuma alba TaxID=207710 RepID=UPI0010A46B46|nr:F-box protein PP2-B10-like [Prosopis alba]XP_028790634.1 F-box protein PP2-B10-like [Prosopis alba]
MDLPEACIAHVLSFTSPRDACRLSCVSSSFRSAADSDALWDSFLPSDWLSLLSRSSPPPSFSSKKHLYLSLSRQPLLIDDDGLKSFWLDKLCGAKCFMLSPRSLSIVWGCTPRYWRWRTSEPKGRFEEVAELLCVCWLEMRGRINTRMLSPSTSYAAYLVFNLTPSAYGFEHQPVEVSVGIAGNDSDARKRSVYLDPNGGTRGRQQPIVPRRASLFNRARILGVEAGTPIPAENVDPQPPNKRADGWLEIELGDFFNEGIDDKALEMAVCEIKGGHWKSGLVIQGIEIRPKPNK